MHNPHEGPGPATLNVNIHVYKETALSVDDVVTSGSACLSIGEWPNEVKLFVNQDSAERLSWALGKALAALDRAMYTEPPPEKK